MIPIGTQSFRSPNKCSTCGPYDSFNWSYALGKRVGLAGRLAKLLSREDRELSNLPKAIERIKRLKFGYLHQCSVCHGYWYLDHEEYFIHRIPADRTAIVREWSSTSLVPSCEQMAALQDIGGTGQDRYGNMRGIVQVPCAITMVDGPVVDPAIVWVTKLAPFHSYLPRIQLLRPDAQIRESQYTLPLQVRVACNDAEEIRMGFAPTKVESAQGRPFILPWGECFFAEAGVSANEIRLSVKSFRFKDSDSIACFDRSQITYFFADWFDAAERLVPPRQ